MSEARIAIVHFHLRRGGVSRVIESTLAALQDRGYRVAVLSGDEEVDPVFQPFHRHVPGLGYTESCSEAASEQLEAALRERARDALGGDPDVWHLHNHSLGKNPNLNHALRSLATSGARLLLHLHDFAEDGRPANYKLLRSTFGDELDALQFPSGGALHYAVLNARDYACLGGAGLDADHLHLLPNPVRPPAVPLPDPPADSNRVLYLTRAIRRKNIGELLLWSAVHRDEARFACSLAPENPKEQIFYHRWTAVARQHGLPVDFNLGGDPALSFEDVVASSARIITTSMAEGFGLSFLEPWLFGRTLCGRNLPEVTGGFRDDGIRLDPLYDRLEVPVHWVDAERLRGIVGAALQQSRAAYGQPCREADVEAALSDMVQAGRVDFGRLGEPLQEAVIARLVDSASARSELSPTGLLHEPADTLLEQNRAVIDRTYSLIGYGDRLDTVYQSLLAAPAGELGSLDGAALLSAFLDPRRFCLIRT